MSRVHIAAAAALLSVAGALAACDARPGADSSAPGQPEDETARTHREFKEALAKRIDDIGRQLDELKAKAQTAAADQRENLGRLADDLAVKKAEAEASLKELGQTAAEEWEVVKTKTERAVLDLEKKATQALK